MLKVTFNQPAESVYFQEEGAVGVRIKIQDDGTVLFKPMRRFVGEDVVPITQRGRGGIELLIEGAQEVDLSKALANPHGYPFFYLVRSEVKDWLTIVPYTGPTQYPPRTRPHLRVWMKNPVQDAQEDTKRWEFRSVIDEIRSAQALVADYRSQKKVGRKPGEIVDAEKLLTAATSVLSDLIDVSGLRVAHMKIGAFLSEIDPAEPEGNTTSIDGPVQPKAVNADPIFPDMDTEIGKDRPDFSKIEEEAKSRSRKASSGARALVGGSPSGRGRSVNA